MPLTQNQKADLFTGHRKLACKLGNWAAAKYGIDRDSACDEALETLGDIIAVGNLPDPINPAPGDTRKMTSWLYLQLRYRLMTRYGRKTGRSVAAHPFSAIESDDRPLDPSAKRSWLEGLLQNLGDDARVIVSTIFNAPSDIAEDMCVRRRGRARDHVRRALENQGWDEDRICNAWMEVAACL
jgi:hypothetical protein